MTRNLESSATYTQNWLAEKKIKKVRGLEEGAQPNCRTHAQVSFTIVPVATLEPQPCVRARKVTRPEAVWRRANERRAVFSARS